MKHSSSLFISLLITMILITMIFFHTAQGRNPFAFGGKKMCAHGRIHDLDLEFKVYTDKKNNVRFKTVKNKSPST